jgi:lipopolysaccharide export system permease protein
MSTLNRYLLKQIATHFLMVLGVLFILYGLVEFLEKVDDFIEHRAALTDYLAYPIYKFPAMVTQILPMATLLAAFSTINLLARTHQLTALSSCGVSLGNVTRPLFAFGGTLCCVAFVMSNWLAPLSTQKAEYVLTKNIRGGGPVKYRKKNIYLRDGQRILTITRSNPKTGVISDITVFELTADSVLSKRVDAASATYKDDGVWLLDDTVVRDFGSNGEVTGFKRHKQLPFDLKRRPAELVELFYQPEQMTSGDLQKLSVKVAGEGRDPLPYRTELHFRQAQALTPLLMILLGVPFALQRGRKYNLGAGIALSLATFLIYYALQATAMAFGVAGWLPLLLAAWSANILLFLIGGWLFLTLDS